VNAGHEPRKGGDAQRLLAIDPDGDVLFERTIAELPTLLHPGDVLVLNDAATIPASLRVRTATGRVHELRLAGPPRAGRWPAVLFGEGDWRIDTDRRPAPEAVRPGDRLVLDDNSSVRIVSVSQWSERLLTIHFERAEADVWPLLYRVGRPVQYAYVPEAVALPDVQTSYAGRPWAVEMPSAGRPLTWGLLLALRKRGIAVVTLTHAAGLSATGDPKLDARLPLRERYELPTMTVAAIDECLDRGHRVIAVGTSVVRALEGNAADHGGVLAPAIAETDLLLGPGFAPQIVAGILSGVHEPGTSHHALLGAFAGPDLLARAHDYALATDLHIHEFGDSTLVLPGIAGASALAA
jgi:S-adenosylmethionine:tRNA ribosyltransferase-isomerase